MTNLVETHSAGPQIVESDAPHCCVQTAPFSGGAAFRAVISASSIRLRGGNRADTLSVEVHDSSRQPHGVAARLPTVGGGPVTPRMPPGHAPPGHALPG